MAAMPEPMDRFEVDAARLVAEHPPRLRDPNKQVVHAIASPPGAVHAGRIGYTRWAAIPLPPRLPHVGDGLLEVRPGYFDYAPVLDGPGVMEWHLNFADAELFAYYGGPLLAQDELQVAEHPALGSLREALLARGSRPRTMGSNAPTPVLVTGVERRVAIDTAPDPGAGRPDGLYGNRFASAPADVVASAVRRLEPPTRTNLLAISAVAGGHGAYTVEQVRRTLVTAWSGFLAATFESARQLDPVRQPRVVIHTGHWGGGAFGGNRTLLALLQLLAANLAGIERLVVHAGDDEAPVHEAAALLPRVAGRPGQPMDEVVEAVVGLGFRWGVPDGN